MDHRKRNAIAVFVMSLLLFAIQAGLWVRATRHTQSETDKQNREQQHPPSEIPGILGMTLLVAAGVIAGVPRRSITPQPDL
jgi:hypothetical protein